MTDDVLQVSDLTKHFGGIKAVDGISFSVRQQEMLALIGPNGAGKSTCFNMLMGQLKPSRGEVVFEGERISGLRPREIWRRGVGRTFQTAAPYPSMTVKENIQTALISNARQSFALLSSMRTKHVDRASELLELTGLSDQADKHCAVLPYGDLKRLELAMALSHRPRLLLMDEPTAGMAHGERLRLMQLTAELVKTNGISVLFTEHDMDVVFGYAHRIVVMNRGNLIAEGTPDDVRANPDVKSVYLGGGLLMHAETEASSAQS